MCTCYHLLMTRQLPATCTECGKSFVLTTKARIDTYHRSGRTYCTTTCRDVWVKRDRSQRMAQTNRRHASARMTERNPMRVKATREKMSATLRRIKHKPRQRGGNSAPTPLPQHTLAQHLGWPTEVVVTPSDGARPYHYKADIAHPTMKVCVEVDGPSHFPLSRQRSDKRRDERLASAGWLTFRFSNQDAMERTAECARTVLSTTSRWSPRTPT